MRVERWKVEGGRWKVGERMAVGLFLVGFICLDGWMEICTVSIYIYIYIYILGVVHNIT